MARDESAKLQYVLNMGGQKSAAQSAATPVTPPSTPPTPNENPLDDIFSDSPPTSPSRPHTNEPSDVPRVRFIHSTAGYRAGISASKTQSLQPGFDEGYSLGATFGLRVGYLSGVLETLYASLKHAPLAERERVRALLLRSRKDLALETVFGKEWWGEDGVWKYLVHDADGRDVDGDGDLTFEQIARCHPLLSKWGAIVDKEMENAGVDRDKFEGAEWERGRIGDKDVD